MKLNTLIFISFVCCIFCTGFSDNSISFENFNGKKVIFTTNKSLVLFVFIGDINCHDCIIRLSKFINTLDTLSLNCEIFGVILGSENAISKKFFKGIITSNFKNIREVYYLGKDNFLFKKFFPKGFKSPALVILNPLKKTYQTFLYDDLFDKNGQLIIQENEFLNFLKEYK